MVMIVIIVVFLPNFQIVGVVYFSDKPKCSWGRETLVYIRAYTT